MAKRLDLVMIFLPPLASREVEEAKAVSVEKSSPVNALAYAFVFSRISLMFAQGCQLAVNRILISPAGNGPRGTS
jgi:hypothetical protein